jgi:TetR/AcrR family transcriptional regulator, repressor for uid operon
VADMLSEIDWLTQSEGPSNSALLFEMLAEAVRNRPVAKTLRAFSRQMRQVLADVLRHGQAQGEIDKDIDPAVAATVVIGIMDALRALPLRYPETDTVKAVNVLKLLTDRLLSPGIAKPASSRRRRLRRSTASD